MVTVIGEIFLCIFIYDLIGGFLSYICGDSNQQLKERLDMQRGAIDMNHVKVEKIEKDIKEIKDTIKSIPKNENDMTNVTYRPL